MPASNQLPHKDKRTNYLGERPAAEPMPLQRLTGPLEEPMLPWVIEFRVVGTADIIKITTRSAMLIGRLDENRGIFPDIDVTDHNGQSTGVSRRHAMMLARDNRVTIQDLGSANGTYINGRILKPNENYRVRDRDCLRLGRLELQVHFVIKPLVDEQTILGMKNIFSVPQLGSNEHILIADENEDVCRVMRFIGEKAGFRVTVAKGVTEAMHIIDNDPPQMVIQELVMGDDSGVDLIRYLRDHHRLSTRQLVATDSSNIKQNDEASHTHHVPPFYSGLLDSSTTSGMTDRQPASQISTQELVAITNPHRVQPDIPIAVMSSITGGYQMGKALQAGADFILEKPVAVDEMIKTLTAMYHMLESEH